MSTFLWEFFHVMILKSQVFNFWVTDFLSFPSPSTHYQDLFSLLIKILQLSF